MTPQKFLKYSLGIPIIDEEHWSIFETAGAIEHDLNRGKYENIRALLQRFRGEFAINCTTEDEVMRRVDYPGIADHRAAHRNLFILIDTLIDLPHDKETKDLIIDGLEDVFAEHIFQYDLTMAHYLHSLEELRPSKYVLKRPEERDSGLMPLS